MPSRWWVSLFLATLSLQVGSGCTGPRLTEVEGTVTLNGEPLDNVQVQFLPDPVHQTTGPRSTGITNAKGHFRLTCDDQRSGAVIGKHRVLIVDLKQWEGIKPGREDANKPLKPSRIPARYVDVLLTPFKDIEVKPEGSPLQLNVTTP